MNSQVRLRHLVVLALLTLVVAVSTPIARDFNGRVIVKLMGTPFRCCGTDTPSGSASTALTALELGRTSHSQKAK